jgi:putative zinc finger protein
MTAFGQDSTHETRHLTRLQLAKALDNELSGAEAVFVTPHLLQCERCSEAFEELRLTSFRLDSLLASLHVESASFHREREQLKDLLVAAEGGKKVQQSPEKVMRRFGWGMAIAATLAMGILVAPKHRDEQKPSSAATNMTDSLEVDGETFIALPYSNPDLPLGSPHIVQMQVPLSSLADIGIMLEPVANQISGPDRSVLADVLVGTDGQPLGVNVLSYE